MQKPPPEMTGTTAEEEPIPELEQLPSEKWEEEGALIYFDEKYDESSAPGPVPDVDEPLSLSAPGTQSAGAGWNSRLTSALLSVKVFG